MYISEGERAANGQQFERGHTIEEVHPEGQVQGDRHGGSVDNRRTIDLHAEQLVAERELRDMGEATIRTVFDEQPARLEVDAYHEELEIEHEPVGQVVTERVGPWEENGVLTIPVYEEQLVVVKRLMLREYQKVRRIGVTERQIIADSVWRERVVIEDPSGGSLLHETRAA